MSRLRTEFDVRCVEVFVLQPSCLTKTDAEQERVGHSDVHWGSLGAFQRALFRPRIFSVRDA